MKKITLILTFFLVFISFKMYSQNPNIVVILVDDAGNNDWGFQGSTISKTPNIDTLADEGMICTQGYVTNSVCAPSRAGMLSGQYQNKFGFEYNIVSYSPAPIYTNNDIGMRPEINTIGDYLKNLGYTTGLFGKWHLGSNNIHKPNNQGFDYFYGLLGGSRNYDKIETSEDKVLRRNDVIVEPSDNNFYLTDLLTDDALNFINEEIDNNKPFLAFMSYTAPHGPYQAKAEDKDLFKNQGLSTKNENYYGMIHNVDVNVKRIIDLLKTRNQYENTIFVFLSDNGGVSKAGSNGVLRGHKSSEFEGGLRVPFFITWKNQITSGITYDKQVISLDLAATFIDAAGGDLTENTYKDLDGKSLLNITQNTDKVLHDRLFWRKLDVWGIVSDGTNKFIYGYDKLQNNQPLDPILYNLQADISETTNIYQANKTSVSASTLLEDYNNWEKTLDLPIWIGNSVLNRVCPTSPNAQSCQIYVDRYGTLNNNLGIYEAEVATLAGTSKVINCTTASGGKSVKNISSGDENTITFSNLNVDIAGQYTIRATYVDKSGGTLQYAVNGGSFVTSTNTTPTDEWCFKGGTPGNIEFNVTFNAGNNTMVIKESVILDKLTIVEKVLSTYENEFKKKIHIFPTLIKSNENINITVPNEFINKLGLVRVININGQSIINKTIKLTNRNFLNIKNIKSGIYFISVYINGVIVTKKFCKI